MAERKRRPPQEFQIKEKVVYKPAGQDADSGFIVHATWMPSDNTWYYNGRFKRAGLVLDIPELELRRLLTIPKTTPKPLVTTGNLRGATVGMDRMTGYEVFAARVQPQVQPSYHENESVTYVNNPGARGVVDKVYLSKDRSKYLYKIKFEGLCSEKDLDETVLRKYEALPAKRITRMGTRKPTADDETYFDDDDALQQGLLASMNTLQYQSQGSAHAMSLDPDQKEEEDLKPAARLVPSTKGTAMSSGDSASTAENEWKDDDDL